MAPVDGAGNITRPGSPIPVTGQEADAPQVNVPIDDIYAAMNMFMFLDGRKSLRGNIPMNGYRAVGAADAVGQQDYVTLAQTLEQMATTLSSVADMIDAAKPYYTGTDSANVDFPVGSVIPVWIHGYDGNGNTQIRVPPNRRQAVTPRISPINGAVGGGPLGSTVYQNAGTGALLTGTWVSSGMCAETYFMAIRRL